MCVFLSLSNLLSPLYILQSPVSGLPLSLVCVCISRLAIIPVFRLAIAFDSSSKISSLFPLLSLAIAGLGLRVIGTTIESALESSSPTYALSLSYNNIL